MAFQVKPGQFVLFTGDSITDAGRRNESAPFGSGYARMVMDLIRASYPEHDNRFLNTGIGGNTVRMLHDRFSDDVIHHQPDWLSILVGINDLNRHLGQSPDGVSPDDYATIYEKILERVRQETSAKLVLMEPFYMSTDAHPESRRCRVLKLLPEYIGTVHEMAGKYDAVLVRTHEMFQRMLKVFPPDQMCPEPVHPNPTGHLYMARLWLREMGWEG